MRDRTWGGFITQTGFIEPSSLLQDSKLFYASEALIFHTVSSHYPPFPQRKIARIKKKTRTPCDRLVHCATVFRLQAKGDEGKEAQEGRNGGGMKTGNGRTLCI